MRSCQNLPNCTTQSQGRDALPEFTLLGLRATSQRGGLCGRRRLGRGLQASGPLIGPLQTSGTGLLWISKMKSCKLSFQK